MSYKLDFPLDDFSSTFLLRRPNILLYRSTRSVQLLCGVYGNNIQRWGHQRRRETPKTMKIQNKELFLWFSNYDFLQTSSSIRATEAIQCRSKGQRHPATSCHRSNVALLKAIVRSYCCVVRWFLLSVIVFSSTRKKYIVFRYAK